LARRRLPRSYLQTSTPKPEGKYTVANELYTSRMPQQLLREAIQQAEGSAPVVQAAALAHCARVMTKFDNIAANQLLERAVHLTHSLASDERSLLLEEFPSIAAGINPALAIELLESLEKKEWGSNRLLFAMLEHGHISEAVTYLTNPSLGAAFP